MKVSDLRAATSGTVTAEYQVIVEVPSAHEEGETAPDWTVTSVRRDTSRGRIVLEIDQVSQRDPEAPA